MLITMNMETGKRVIEDEFGAFADEVMNAENQSRSDLQLGLQEACSDPSFGSVAKHGGFQTEAELNAFLRSLYTNQA